MELHCDFVVCQAWIGLLEVSLEICRMRGRVARRVLQITRDADRVMHAPDESEIRVAAESAARSVRLPLVRDDFLRHDVGYR